ncbi:MAG TPA: hypothetical protein VD788_14945 [Candidatus Polarisedimenticolaceae bacterium]|nr:hypothetical protein [Candidatus Polarisedimenticolaceae bacterium]
MRVIVCTASAVLLLVFAGCAARQPIEGQPTTALDRKLSTFAFIEEGDLITLIVGTQAARYREKSEFMPVEVMIANNGLKNLVLTRESFTLIDEQGNRYPLARPQELYEGYDFLDLDRQALSTLPDVTTNKFAAYTRYGSRFSPTRSTVADLTGSGSLVRDAISVPKFGYIWDFLYFPRPVTGIKGHRFELFVESAGLEDPVFVKFEVK